MHNKKIYFICDLFKEDYIGGAELTTDALKQYAPQEFEVHNIHSENITEKFLKKNINNLFIIGNFQNLNIKNKLFLIKNNKYSIIEYDYKFCKYRSIEKHKKIEAKDCNCVEEKNNKINLLFYAHAHKIWFMSKKQKNIFLNKLNFLDNKKTNILSSVFSIDDLNYILNLNTKEKNNQYIILNSPSWIKGTQENINIAKNKNLNYQLISNIPYKDLLNLLAKSKGLIFCPLGSDTCPRLVIEAKLLECDLILNDNVQHKDEDWFLNKNTCINYLKNNANLFWEYYKNV